MRRSLLALLAVGLVVATAVLLLGPQAETPAGGVLPQPGEHAPAHEPSAALPAPQPRSFASPEAIEPHPPTRDPDAAALRLLVRSRAGAVIAGAELWMQALEEGEVFERIGATDDAGALAHRVIVLQRTFAAHLRFGGPERAPLQADARLWGRSNPTWFWNVAELQGVGTDSILAVLLGIDLEKTQRQPSDGGATLLFLSADEQAESVGPIQVRGSLIGHAPVSTEIRIPAYRAQLAELSIPLESLAAAWGELRIRFVGLRGARDRRNNLVQELGTLSVRSLDEDGFFEQKLREWTDGELVLGEVPVGRYAVLLHSTRGYSGFEPREGNPIFVGVGETTVTFDLSASREVEVQVRMQDGELHSSEIVLDLQHDGASSFLVYSAAPYILRGLLPRTYDLELFAPFHGGKTHRLHLSGDRDPELPILVSAAHGGLAAPMNARG